VLGRVLIVLLLSGLSCLMATRAWALDPRVPLDELTVRITVSDDGAGIPEDVEPFFTTGGSWPRTMAR